MKKANFVVIAVFVLLGARLCCAQMPLLSQIRTWNDFTNVVAKAGNYAYVGVGRELHVLEISNPVHVQEVGFLSISGTICDMVVRDSLAFVACGQNYSNIFVIRIVDPAHPVVVGSAVCWSALALALSDHYAYVAADTAGLKVFDLSNPVHPVLVSTYNTPGHARGVALSGRYAYVADDSSGLRIIDINDPLHPTEAGNYHSTGYPVERIFKVAVEGDYAYVCGSWQYYGYIRAINIGIPTLPVAHGMLWYPCDAFEIKVAGDLAYLGYGYGLRIINVSNPDTLRSLGSWNGSNHIGGIVLTGDTAFLADTEFGLDILNMSDSLHPAFIGYYSYLGFARTAIAENGNAYLYLDSGIEIIDIHNPSDPYEVACFLLGGTAVQMVLANSRLYIPEEYGVTILDVSNPHHPEYLARFPLPNLQAEAIAVSGNRAYILTDSHGLRIVDITDPAHPTLRDTSAVSAYEGDVAVADSFVYVVDGRSLKIINVRESLAHPMVVGNFVAGDTTSNAQCISINGHYAYLGTNHGLLTVDISNPTAPFFAHFNPTAGRVTDITCSAHYLFVGTQCHGLIVFDCSNPAIPDSIGGRTLPSCVAHSNVSGNLLLAANQTFFSIYDASQYIAAGIPRAPEKVTAYLVPNAHAMRIKWQPVTQDTMGFVLPSLHHYVVFRSNAYEGLLWDSIGTTPPSTQPFFMDSTFTGPRNYYRVKAVAD